MTLLTSPLFYVFALIIFIVSYIISKKYADKKIPDNPYLSDPKIREVLENPEKLKEKLSQAEVILSDGKEHKITKFFDNGKEIKL